MNNRFSKYVDFIDSNYTLVYNINEKNEIQQFFLNNNKEVLKPYIEIAPKPNGNLNFYTLKVLYLLDKDIRICIYNILEEIETALKSFIFSYVKYHNIDLTDEEIYISSRYKEYHIERIISKIIKNGTNSLYFSEVSKILSSMKRSETNLILLNDINKYFKPQLTLRNFQSYIHSLSLLRNAIAHHESCIIYSRQRRYFNNKKYSLKNILEDLKDTLNNIRPIDNKTNWLDRVEDHIYLKTSEYAVIKSFMGYPINR